MQNAMVRPRKRIPLIGSIMTCFFLLSLCPFSHAASEPESDPGKGQAQGQAGTDAAAQQQGQDLSSADKDPYGSGKGLLDEEPPYNPIVIESPAAGSVVSGTVEVKIKYQEFVANVAVSFDAVKGLPTESGKMFEFGQMHGTSIPSSVKFDTTVFGNGPATIYVLSYDQVNEYGFPITKYEATLNVVVENFKIKVIYPVAGQTVKGNEEWHVQGESTPYMISLEASPPGKMAKKSYYKPETGTVDSKMWFDTSVYPNGPLNLLFKSYYKLGNIKLLGSMAFEVPVTVQVANAYDFSIVKPEEGDVLKGKVGITLVLDETVDNFVLEFGDHFLEKYGTIYKKPTVPTFILWDTAKETDKEHKIIARSFDNTGNIAVQREVKVLVANQKDYSFEILSPQPGAQVEGNVELKLKLSPDIQKLWITFGTTQKQTFDNADGKPPKETTIWDTMIEEDGDIAFEVSSFFVKKPTDKAMIKQLPVKLHNRYVQIHHPVQGQQVSGPLEVFVKPGPWVKKLDIQYVPDNAPYAVHSYDWTGKTTPSAVKDTFDTSTMPDGDLSIAMTGKDAYADPSTFVKASVTVQMVNQALATQKTQEESEVAQTSQEEWDVEIHDVRINERPLEDLEGQDQHWSDKDLQEGRVVIHGEEKSNRPLERIEVSTDRGQTWHPAKWRDSWEYSFEPQDGKDYDIRFRAVAKDGTVREFKGGQRLKLVYRRQGDAGQDAWQALQEMGKSYEREELRTFLSYVSEDFPHRGELEEFSRRDFRDYDGIGLNFYLNRTVPTQEGVSVDVNWEMRYFTTAVSRKILLKGNNLSLVFRREDDRFRLIDMRGENPLFGGRSPDIAVASGVSSEVGRTLQKIEDQARRSAQQTALVLVADTQDTQEQDIPVTLSVVEPTAFYQDGAMEQVNFDAITTGRPMRPQATVRILDNPKNMDFTGIELRVTDSLSGFVNTIRGNVNANREVVFQTGESVTFPDSMAGRSGRFTFELDPERKFITIDEEQRKTRRGYTIADLGAGPGPVP